MATSYGHDALVQVYGHYCATFMATRGCLFVISNVPDTQALTDAFIHCIYEPHMGMHSHFPKFLPCSRSRLLSLLLLLLLLFLLLLLALSPFSCLSGSITQGLACAAERPLLQAVTQGRDSRLRRGGWPSAAAGQTFIRNLEKGESPW